MDQITPAAGLKGLAPSATTMRAVAPVAVGLGAGTRIVRGRAGVLAQKQVLIELASRCRQSGEVDQLVYFLNKPDALKKLPWLVLLGAEDGSGEIVGAVLLFEYLGPLGLRSKVFAGADGTGRRDVLAAPALRASIAGRAVRILMDRGAHVVHLAFDEAHTESLAPCWCEEEEEKEEEKDTHRDAQPALDRGLAEMAFGQGLSVGSRHWVGAWTVGETEVEQYLKLESTYNATLARIGQRTRSNLRYYRRRSEHDLGCHFVTDVKISLEEFLAHNRRCRYAVSDTIATQRYRTMGHGTFLYGIRDREQNWLSLVGGRRQHGAVEIDWQMNRGDRPHYSLATVVRSYLIEYEIGLGTRRLYIEGGTPHPITRSFVKGPVWEATVKRRSLYVRFLEQFSKWIFPEKNYLAQMLRKRELIWRRW